MKWPNEQMSFTAHYQGQGSSAASQSLSLDHKGVKCKCLRCKNASWQWDMVDFTQMFPFSTYSILVNLELFLNNIFSILFNEMKLLPSGRR